MQVECDLPCLHCLLTLALSLHLWRNTLVQLVRRLRNSCNTSRVSRLVSVLMPSRADSSILFGTLNRFSHCQRSYLGFVHGCFAPPGHAQILRFYLVLNHFSHRQRSYLGFVCGCLALPVTRGFFNFIWYSQSFLALPAALLRFRLWMPRTARHARILLFYLVLSIVSRTASGPTSVSSMNASHPRSRADFSILFGTQSFLALPSSPTSVSSMDVLSIVLAPPSGPLSVSSVDASVFMYSVQWFLEGPKLSVPPFLCVLYCWNHRFLNPPFYRSSKWPWLSHISNAFLALFNLNYGLGSDNIGFCDDFWMLIT